MRHPLITLVLATAFLAACSDHEPVTASMRPTAGALSNVTLSDHIDAQISTLLTGGHRTSVAARWTNVKRAKNAGDMADAVAKFNQLAAWLDDKTGSLTPPAGTTRAEAAFTLVVNMARWLYEGGNATPIASPGPDVAIAVAPAGESFFMQTPSQHAGVTWGEGSTDEDRLVVLAQDPNPYPGHCNGPLQTRRCQYPLFYQLHTYPHVRLNQPGRFAVCMVTTGDRRPLEYPQDEAGPRPIDNRLRVAHNLPANPADYTPGATQEDGIEILPLSATQSGTLIDCDEPNHHAMGTVERFLYQASRLAARYIAPKNAWAWDAGPEHDFSFTSSFNGVDPQSEPDLAVTNFAAPATLNAGDPLTVSYSVANVSRRSGGDATAASKPTTARAYLSADQVIDGTDQLLGTTTVPAMAPDATPLAISHSGVVPSAGSWYVIVKVDSVGPEVTYANNKVMSQLSVVAAPAQTGPFDQQYTQNTGTGFSCPNGSGDSIYQSFTPTASTLVAVDVALRYGGSFPPGGMVKTMKIRDGSPTGTIIGTATLTVPQAPTGTTTWVTFNFQTALATVPGNTYVIELALEPLQLAWIGEDPGGYAGGTGYGCSGQPGTFDLNFRTIPAPVIL